MTLKEGDASQGWDKDGPFDVIAITGSFPLLPDSFGQNLKPGGRLLAFVGQTPVIEAILITRTNDNEWNQESLFETELPMLLNAKQPSRFVF